MGIENHFTHVDELPPPPELLDFKRWPARGAVVALLSSDDTLIQLFSTQSLRKALEKRLGTPEPSNASSRRANLREVTRRVAWTPAYSAFENTWQYLERARRLMPDRYRRTLPFKSAWFASIDLNAELPRWTPSIELHTGELQVGPFRGKRSCVAFISQLEDDFELCRKFEELLRAPSGKPCAYFDMGRCPAPCNGTVPLTHYREQIDQSVRFLQTNADERIKILRDEMNLASRNLRFEQAAFLKARVAQMEPHSSEPADYRDFAHPIDHFRLLTLQRGATPKRWHVFFVDRRGISEAEQFDPVNLEKLAADWWTRLSSSSCSGVDNKSHSEELISLVSFFARKRGRGNGLFVHRDQVPTVADLEAIVRAFFTPQPKTASLSDNG